MVPYAERADVSDLLKIGVGVECIVADLICTRCSSLACSLGCSVHLCRSE